MTNLVDLVDTILQRRLPSLLADVPTIRLGTVAGTAPLTVTLDGEDTAIEVDDTLAASTVAVADRVLVIAQADDAVLLGTIGEGGVAYLPLTGGTLTGAVGFEAVSIPLTFRPGSLVGNVQLNFHDFNDAFAWILQYRQSTGIFRWYSASDGEVMSITQAGDLAVAGDLNVTGTKNAQIADPDDATKAYRFAAVEFDTPGTLGTTIRDVAVDASKETRVPVPEHFTRIGANPMVFVTYATEPQGSTPHGPWAYVVGWDGGAPEIVLRAPQGTYHLLLLFTRADVAAAGWTHDITVEPASDAVAGQQESA